MITATDNLNGFTQPFAAFSLNLKLKSVVHQIRNACKYVVWKDRKDFTADMKNIFTPPNKQAAEAALNDFAQKWKSKYAYANQVLA